MRRFSPSPFVLALALSFVVVTAGCSKGQDQSKLTSPAWTEFKTVALRYDSLMLAIDKMQKSDPALKANPMLLSQRLQANMATIQEIMQKAMEKADPAMKEITSIQGYGPADLHFLKVGASLISDLEKLLTVNEQLLPFVVDKDSLRQLKMELIQLHAMNGNMDKAGTYYSEDMLKGAEAIEQAQILGALSNGYSDAGNLAKAKEFGAKAMTVLKDGYTSAIAPAKDAKNAEQIQMVGMLYGQQFVGLLSALGWALTEAGDTAGKDALMNEAKTAINDPELWKTIEQAVSGQIAQKVEENKNLNKPAAAWAEHEWIGSAAMSLESLKGKVILLDFFATWCKPCINAFPHIREWKDKYGAQGLVVIGMTNYQGRYDNAQVQPADELGKMKNEFIPKHKISWPVAIEKSGRTTFEKYGVSGIPHITLIDKKGNIRYFKVGAGDYAKTEQQIKKLLAE